MRHYWIGALTPVVVGSAAVAVEQSVDSIPTTKAIVGMPVSTRSRAG
jgi:hypothetical protein